MGSDPAAVLRRLPDPVMRRRARHVHTEMARVTEAVDALEAGDHARFGAAMTASHRSLRDDFEVSCAELDAVVEGSLGQGALGARMTGGGFGGSAIALLPADRVEVAIEAIAARFAGAGWGAPGVAVVTAAAGGRVLRA